MWADNETDLDFLNYSEVAELAVDLLKDHALRPLSIGVFGSWGSGKSSLLKLIEGELNRTGGTDYQVVRFDAWLYQGYDDARAALMEVIGAELVTATEAAKGEAPLLDKAKRFLGRVNYFRALGLLAEGSAAALGVPTFGVVAKGLGAVGDMISGTGKVEDITAIREAGKDVVQQGKGLLRADTKLTPPSQIEAFRQELGEILTGLGKTLVVFVDNLDRCLPKQTIQTLEALRLFLFMPNTAFVVAADEDMVRHSVAAFFADLDERHVTDYLDKLIQVPVRVPRLGEPEVRAYMFLLFAIASGVGQAQLEALRQGLEANLRSSWRAEPLSRTAALKLLGQAPPGEVVLGFDIADRMAGLLTRSSLVQGNPRIVKRLLNVVRLRARLANRRSMPIDEALIAKLALFERCTDALATAELYNRIQDAPEGKPDLFATLEALHEDPEGFRDACPEPWKARHLDFIREWMSLEPKLSATDLRPALYLSRETQPLKLVHGALSAPATEALRILLKTSSINSPSARNALATVAPQERGAIMEAILVELRQHDDWKKRPPAFNGAFVLAGVSPEAAQLLAAFLKGTIPGKPPPWLVAQLKTASWFSQEGR